MYGYGGSSNFLIKHEHRDFFSDVQRAQKRIGEVGKESEDFTDRAYKQFQAHDFHKLAQIQDGFEPEDETAGTKFRPKTRNYNRMEYDMPERHDGKEHADVMKVLDGTSIKVKDVLHAFDKSGYNIVSAAQAIGSDPITKEDYDDQIKI